MSLLVGFGSGFGVRAYMAEKDAQAVELAQQKELSKAKDEYIEKVDKRDTAYAELQRTMSQKDLQHTEALNAKINENSELRTDLGVAQRMRFNGAVCPKGPAAASPATAGSLGDDSGLELTAEARQDVFDIRAGIVNDQAKVVYLQDYITTVLKLPVPDIPEAASAR